MKLKVKDLKDLIFDKIVIYRTDKIYDDFIDLYKGEVEGIPCDILSLTVHSIGAKRKGILDIEVEWDEVMNNENV